MVAGGIPRLQFVLQGLVVTDAAVQALAGQNAQFDFGDIEPTAVTRGIDQMESLGQVMRLLSGERFVQGGDGVRVEVVADEMNLACLREVLVQQLPDLMGPIDAGTMLRGRDTTPAQQWRKEHE